MAVMTAINRMPKSFEWASATLEGVQVANMIRKGQITSGLCPFAQFAVLAT